MGGTWKTQNKRRPGAYVNVKGNGQFTSESNVGRLLMLSDAELGWGAKGVISLNKGSNFKAKLGTTLEDAKLSALKEALKGADTVLFVNTNDGVKASLTAEGLPWTFTAKYPGTKGNNLSVTVEPDPANAKKATISTLFNTEIVDQQSVTADTVDTLESNDYVDVAPKAVSEDISFTSSNQALSGGTDTPAKPEDLMNDALENENYAVVTTGGFSTSSNIHGLLVTALKRLRDDEGIKVRGVVPVGNPAPAYNYEGVSTVVNGFIDSEGNVVSVTDAAAYFAGISCSADAGTALTYYEVEDAISANPQLDNEKTIDALNAGQIVFTTKPGQRVVIEQDINSLYKFTADKPKVFSKNRVMRTLDDIVTNTEEVFENTFLGKVGNNANGRDLFKGNRITYLNDLQNRNIIQEFENSDITVEKGNDSDSILVNLAVTPVDAMEKLYMTIIVN